jgi:hypothetical protein
MQLQGLAFAMLYKEASLALGTSVCEQHRLYVGVQPEGCPMQPVEIGLPELQLRQSTLIQSEVPIPDTNGLLTHQVI